MTKHTLIHWHGEFYRYTGTHYTKIEEASVRPKVYDFIARSCSRDGDALKPNKPNKNKVENVMDALRATAHLPNTYEPPCWLDEREMPPAGKMISMRNGLLNLETCTLSQHTPDFFCTNSLTFDYDRDAKPPKNWLKFLDSQWADDPEAIRTLQEVMGCLITGDTRYQKIFAVIGPKRSGKGTMMNVTTTMIGPENVCNPTLNSFGFDFGLAPLIGKTVAIVGDARTPSGGNQHAITETLLGVSGGDRQSINRKYLPVLTVKLPTQFVIVSNELPRLPETSGALASRFVILTMRNSFIGREDHGLEARLLQELPGIFNWALEGWQRLNKRGCFIVPKSSKESTEELEDLTSPVSKFLRERCKVSETASVSVQEIFREWESWCTEHGRAHAGTLESFGRDLRACVPTLRRGQPRAPGGGRVSSYHGIGLKTFSTAEKLKRIPKRNR